MRDMIAQVTSEPPQFPFGATLPEGLYYPGHDPTIPPNELGAAFGRWASCFHTPVSELPGVDDLQTITQRPEMSQVSDDPRFKPLVEQLSFDELSALVEPAVLQNSGRKMNETDPTVWWENAERALFNVDTNGALNHIAVVVLWCDMTVPLELWSISYVKDRFDRARRDGHATRNHSFVKIENVNHFVRLSRSGFEFSG